MNVSIASAKPWPVFADTDEVLREDIDDPSHLPMYQRELVYVDLIKV